MSAAEAGIDPVDAARADLFALLATVLWRPPDAALLARLAVPASGEGELAAARRALAQAAAEADPERVGREYFALFTGLGGGEVLPYASYYRTGFLHGRPLAEVRADLNGLGLAPVEALAEPEDHLAFQCEVMAVLLRDAAARPAAATDFFVRHLQPWAARCFADLEAAAGARFYRAAGRFGRTMMEIEAAACTLPP